MKFYTGNKSKYNPELHSNGIYFTNDKNISTILAQGKEYGNNLHEVLWQELKDLRDNSELTPGSLYRITDYQCTTTQQNTQSAGHQFDIVLLALSENKLAEEGWAMMHDNIYDVTFDDGVTKKCYLYKYHSGALDVFNIVDVSTLLGAPDIPELTAIQINGNSATTLVPSVALVEPNLTYNYFQNSNLSAWKVWYCLDNDTNRFAWADDSVDEDVTEINSLIGADNKTYTADGTITVDGVERVRYKPSDAPYRNMVTIEEPIVGVTIYATTFMGSSATLGDAETTITSIDSTITHEGTGEPNGRGVIYRLIDEWNNDCPYDFKNIQYSTKINTSSGYYDNSGTSILAYTFNYWDVNNSKSVDASVIGKYAVNDENGAEGCYNNFVCSVSSYIQYADINGIFKYALPYNIMLSRFDSTEFKFINNIQFGGESHDNILTGSDIPNTKLFRCSSVKVLAGAGGGIILDTISKELDDTPPLVIQGKTVTLVNIS